MPRARTKARPRKPKREPAAGDPAQTPAFNAALAALKWDGPKDEAHLKNGVKLRLRPVPPILIRKATGHLKRPVVPKADIGKGRLEDNPADPVYVAAMEEFGQQAFDAGAHVMLAMGTSVLELPDGVDPPEGEDWVELLSSAGFDMDVSNKHARYLSWLTYYAITSEEDVLRVVLGVSKLTGVPESEVAAAAESFRGGETRGSDNGVSAEAP